MANGRRCNKVCGERNMLKQNEAGEIVAAIDRDGKNLTDWEIKFIEQMIDDPPCMFSVNQLALIEEIYDEKV